MDLAKRQSKLITITTHKQHFTENDCAFQSLFLQKLIFWHLKMILIQITKIFNMFAIKK